MATPQRKASDVHPVTETPGRYLKRDEAADLLGVSVGTMLAHEQRGRIVAHWAVVPMKSGGLRSSPLYLIEDVLKLPRKVGNLTPENPDELCARAFEAFETGKSLREIVILLRIAYPKLIEIHEQWKDSGGVALEVPEAIRKQIERKLGPITCAEDLAAKVGAL